MRPSSLSRSAPSSSSGDEEESPLCRGPDGRPDASSSSSTAAACKSSGMRQRVLLCDIQMRSEAEAAAPGSEDLAAAATGAVWSTACERRVAQRSIDLDIAAAAAGAVWSTLSL